MKILDFGPIYGPILDSGHLNDEKVCCLMLDPNLESEPFDEEITLQVQARAIILSPA